MTSPKSTLNQRRSISSLFEARAARPPAASGRPQTAGQKGSKMRPNIPHFWTQDRLVTTPDGLVAQSEVTNCPVIQQGLRGMKTEKQVRDKVYCLGLLQSEINKLTTEQSKLQKEMVVFTQEKPIHLMYEKRAKDLAGEIKHLQEQLADYNLLFDKLNTNTVDEMINDFVMLKAQNDSKAKHIEDISMERKEKEDIILAVQEEIERVKQAMDDSLIKMSPKKQAEYAKMKRTFEKLQKEIDTQQEELDALLAKEKNFEAELVHSQAAFLYKHLQDLELGHNAMPHGTSADVSMEECERLVGQANKDNQDIVSMEQQLASTRERINQLKEELQQLINNNEPQSERNQKYYKLQKKENEIDAYLKTFEECKALEMERIQECKNRIMALMKCSSRTTNCIGKVSSVRPHEFMHRDLRLNETDMWKLWSPDTRLSSKSKNLQEDLLKTEQLKETVLAETDFLKKKILQMSEGLNSYRDLDTLKPAREKTEMLQEEKKSLMKKRDNLKQITHKMNREYEALAAQLQKNEIHGQLRNLERKWQNHEQNNLAMKEIITLKAREGDYTSVKRKVTSQLSDYNKILTHQWSSCRSLTKRTLANW